MTAPVERWRGAPEPVITELRQLEAAGQLTTREVVNKASDPRSALHDQFEWDNEIASDKFRLVQAALLINRVKIHVSEDEVVMVRPAFVAIKDGTGQRRRVATSRALVDPNMYEQVVADTRAQIFGLRNRLSAFEQAGPIVERLDQVIEQL